MAERLILDIDKLQIFPKQSLEHKISYIGKINGLGVSESGAGIGINYSNTSGSCALDKTEFIEFLSICFPKETISKYFPLNNFSVLTDPSQKNLYNQLKDKFVIALYDKQTERISGLVPIL